MEVVLMFCYFNFPIKKMNDYVYIILTLFSNVYITKVIYIYYGVKSTALSQYRVIFIRDKALTFNVRLYYLLQML